MAPASLMSSGREAMSARERTNVCDTICESVGYKREDGPEDQPGRRAFVDVLAAIQTASQTIQLHSRPFTNNEMAGAVTLSSTA
ncbi:hypothetical protein WM31_05245 [Burkholderia ubonensis]|nr:hypothetical protein WK76_01250 [Burkholderia ubonensis]KWO75457.1 hypothetical protein WM31_05245 [Burkholderia ubonensis]